MTKLLVLVLSLLSLNTFAIDFFQAGEAISADKINTIISDSMRVFEKSGTNTFGTPLNNTNKMLATGRSVVITKKYDQTAILIKYSDVFRTTAADKMCTIYLEVDGVNCANGANYKSIYMATSADINAIAISAVCTGMPKGTYTAKVMVKNGAHVTGWTGGYCEFTWADNSSYSVSAQEILAN